MRWKSFFGAFYCGCGISFGIVCRSGVVVHDVGMEDRGEMKECRFAKIESELAFIGSNPIE